jgi:metal-sulfur cluster biosynthetic enzyme
VFFYRYYCVHVAFEDHRDIPPPYYHQNHQTFFQPVRALPSRTGSKQESPTNLAQMSGKNLNPTVHKLKDSSLTAPISSTRTTFASFLNPVGSNTTNNSTGTPSPILTLEEKVSNVGDNSANSASSANSNNGRDRVTKQEIFDIIRRINDPEHPLTLEQLNVVQMDLINVDDAKSRVEIQFTPTIPHCSMATLIGLSITTKLIRSLPIRFKINVSITPGTHNQENEVNKQLNDKERVAAALENKHLLQVVDQCIAHTDGETVEG